MAWFRNTKRSSYSTLRATGRGTDPQWPSRTDARNDVQDPAAQPGSDMARPEGGPQSDNAAGRRRSGDFLYGR
jgi:hypothetical protein